MRSILDDPKLVKDIENALSSSSFQSLIPQNSNRGFVWSLKPQNIFWQGVFAGSILSDVNESLVRNLENTDGLLKMRWIDSLKRVVLHYQLVGDSNLWASPACALLFSHEVLQSSASVHDLHRSPSSAYMFLLQFVYTAELMSSRMLVDIVTLRRVSKCDCRLVRDSTASLPANTSSESNLAQAFSRSIIQCEGDLDDPGQSIAKCSYDCFGETSLMHAAVINDLNLAKCVYFSITSLMHQFLFDASPPEPCLPLQISNTSSRSPVIPMHCTKMPCTWL
jgi:hypothetical protein